MIALDATGGDHGPSVTVAAARTAVRDHGLRVALVGPGLDDPALGIPAGLDGLTTVPASSTVPMEAEAALGVRDAPYASVRVAARLVADGRAEALVSAGHTGATLAAALLDIRRLHGVRRPVLAATLPPALGGAVLVDAGAAPDTTPEALTASARMGAAYARVRGHAEPTLGLLNVGAERGKGSALVREAFEGLAAVPGFVGNVEPGDVLAGAVDVVVTDGFTGNIVLKTVEALARRLTSTVSAAAGADRDGPGAAVLLGVGGTVCVAHGAAREAEIVAALRTAAALGRDLPAALGRALDGAAAVDGAAAGDAAAAVDAAAGADARDRAHR